MVGSSSFPLGDFPLGIFRNLAGAAILFVSPVGYVNRDRVSKVINNDTSVFLEAVAWGTFQTAKPLESGENMVYFCKTGNGSGW